MHEAWPRDGRPEPRELGGDRLSAPAESQEQQQQHQHYHQQQHQHHHQQQPPDSHKQAQQPTDWFAGQPSAVRTMIAQHWPEILALCVIVIYLIYYFSQVSSRPKLIGNDRSKFVKFIKSNLHETLNRRFNPLIYFWGTNPQTALFGYLQGNSSVHEMPRNKFLRQFLYVSDAQYLASNVDLEEHYARARGERAGAEHALRLQVEAELAGAPEADGGGRLDANIRLALGSLQLEVHSSRKGSAHSSHSSDASSDSGVFAGGLSSAGSSSAFAGGSSRGSSASSTSSLADEPLSGSSSGACALADGRPCACRSPYESPPPTMSRRARGQLHAEQHHLNHEHEHGHHHRHKPLRERFQFGQCALDWHKDSHRNYHANRLVALVSAGMTTGSDKKYVTDAVRELERLGYECCVFIRRGVGGLKLSSDKFFSPAKWRDFEAAVATVRRQRPEARLVAVGFSFGSIELCRYLSMSGARSLIDAALLISCPFDPEAGGRNMRKRLLNRRIDAYLARNLGKQLFAALGATAQQAADCGRADECASAGAGATPSSPDLELGGARSLTLTNYHGSTVDLARLPKIKSLVHFEDNFNRLIQNYPSSEAYAADSRLADHLAAIRTPTLCLSSEDDFMAPLKLLPLEQIRQNKHLCMVLTKRGGHMAFIDGLLWPKRPFFALRIITGYLGAVKTSLLAAPKPPASSAGVPSGAGVDAPARSCAANAPTKPDFVQITMLEPAHC